MLHHLELQNPSTPNTIRAVKNVPIAILNDGLSFSLAILLAFLQMQMYVLNENQIIVCV